MIKFFVLLTNDTSHILTTFYLRDIGSCTVIAYVIAVINKHRCFEGRKKKKQLDILPRNWKNSESPVKYSAVTVAKH